MKLYNVILLLSFVTFEVVAACMTGEVACSMMKRTLAIHAQMVETGEDLQEQFRESLTKVSGYLLMSSLATLFTVLTFGALYIWHEGFRKRLSSDPITTPFFALLLLLGPCIGFGNFAGIYGALWYQPNPEDLSQFKLWIVVIFFGNQAIFWRTNVVKQRRIAAEQSKG